MLLLIDGYNLLHSGHPLVNLNPLELQWERDRLIERLSLYRQARPSEIIVVFDGWQGGGREERHERRRGIEVVYSKLGEKADEVIKRLVRAKGSGAIVISSDREISKFAEKFSIPVIRSEQFLEKLKHIRLRETVKEEEEEEMRGGKKKGPSRRLSKKERRLRLALKKL